MKNIGQQKHKCNNKIICYIYIYNIYKKKDIVVNIDIFVKKKMKKKNILIY